MQAKAGGNWKAPDHHIHQRRAMEEKEQEYLQYTREFKAIDRTTHWHESYEKFAVGKRNAANEKHIQQELQQANSELKVLRNKRLQELYTNEWQQ